MTQSPRHCTRTNREARARGVGFWGLVAAGEPFRVLFPLGTLLGLLGVALWPLHVAGLWSTYPGVPHGRIMIHGFLTSFVVGFLGTALPRLIDVPRFRIDETLGFVAALLLGSAFHLAGHSLWGDQVFVATILALLFLLGVRAFLRKDTPPPSFVLVILGLTGALTGACIGVLSQVAPAVVDPRVATFGRLLMNQAYLLLPVMGIGAFLLPRFFGLPNRQTFPESLAPPPGWGLRAAFAAGCGLVAMAGFAAEALGHARAGFALRALAVAVYLLREVPVHRAGLGGGTLAFGIRIALLSLPAGYVLMAVWPARASSFLHVVLITGFSLITFTVASRVVLGHSGQSGKFHAIHWPVRAMFGLLVLAMLTRVSADWMPAIRLTHYAYAAILWAAGALIWAGSILPGVRLADGEQ